MIDRDIPTPSVYIHPLDVGPDYYDVFDNALDMVDTIAGSPYPSYRFPSFRPLFASKVPVTRANRHPASYSSALLYEFASGLAASQIPGNPQAIEEDPKLQADVTYGIVNLLDGMNLAYMGNITWEKAKKRINRRNELEYVMFSNSNQPHFRTLFNTRWSEFQFSWAENNPQLIHMYEPKDYSLVSRLSSRLRIRNYPTTIMSVYLEVMRVPWISGEDGRLETGPPFNILPRFLGVAWAEKEIAQANFEVCKRVQGRLIEILRINQLFPGREGPTLTEEIQEVLLEEEEPPKEKGDFSWEAMIPKALREGLRSMRIRIFPVRDESDEN